MNILKTAFFAAMFLSTSLFCTENLFAQYNVVSIKALPEKPLPKGVFYTLPQNGIKIQITIQKTNFHKGVYGDYASTLLGLNGILSTNSLYEIKSIELTNFSLPDPEQIFYIYAPSASFPKLHLLNNGILQSVNSNRPPKGNRKIWEKSPLYDPSKSSQSTSLTTINSTTPLADLNIYQHYDTIIKQEKKDSLTIIKIITPRIEEKSSSQKAKDMANLILESQKNRADLVSGLQEVNYPAETIKFMYDQLQKAEKEYMDCFVGHIDQEELVYEFEIMPDSAHSYPLALFTHTEGLQAYDSNLLNANNTSSIISLELEILPSIGSASKIFEQNGVDNRIPKGIYYRQAQEVKASLSYENKKIASTNLFVAQWGETLSLPVLKEHVIILNSTNGNLIYMGKNDKDMKP
ncbi:MAG: DUF4831 family protein [Bacteroidales bacterium]